ncbi:tetratricopeptide repeat protein [Neolewinella aurantiaca]|uniref:Tetratricopeptide repeat protein n=1 Tax=Neolewinella aurantiaca TaxID=2602767 RepID=A0A5C7FWZ5_9BACT|nr:tetratricopeptide repeat protein [Neolewinella aurantiaca]TXF89431.1 tetratricopeptide repeat protein [Neolewinella aurantiaca]
MKPLIPPFIQQRLLADQLHGDIVGFTMNIDLSGFTPLTESLMKEGPVGAERLSLILNEIFEPIVALVYARGGFIPYFAGDAFTAVFPGSLDRLHAIHLLHTADKARTLFQERDNRFGEYTIGVKAGIAAGTVNYGIVGDGLRAFYFRGAAIDQAAYCQMQANEQDIVMDETMHSLLEDQSIVAEEVNQGAYRVVGDVSSFLDDVDYPPLNLPAVDAETATTFLPPEVVRYDQTGEFRSVVSAFLAFSEVGSHEELNEFSTVVLNQVNDFGGYFKEVDFGDKGSLMVIFFGAPVSYENNAVRALEFCLTVKSELDALREEKQSAFRYRMGLTVGTAFTGIVGGKERAQYACVGNFVNLAARIMGSADWQDILVDEELAKAPHFRFQLKGDIHYKGIQGAVPTFSLNGRRQSLGKPSYGGELVGREKEVAELLAFAQPIFEGKCAGLAYVLGEAGIGKSRLTHEVHRQLNQKDAVNWLLASSDQILRKPFNPFTYLLRRMFRQSIDLAGAQNERRFQFRISQLKQSLRRLGQSAVVENTLRELERTESVLAAQLGIAPARSLWTQLDAQGRYQNTIAAIVNLLVAECLAQPTVLELEDIHWVDDDSIAVIRELVRRTTDLPLLIIATSRAEDDGTYPQLITPKAREKIGLPVLKVEISALDETAVRKMAEVTLGAPIGDDCLETLLRATNSNPFYLEQVLEYFRENDLLVAGEDGALHLSDESIKLSTSITSILTSRIDRLSDMVRETVKAAAVIGREFDIPVLSEVIREDNGLSSSEEVMSLLREQIEVAEKGQIWSAMNELRYIFRHSLLREAVYSMQLTTRLQQLHRQIADAIKKLYFDNIEERYVDLAFHYEQAGEKEETVEYLGKAANYARANFQNQQALDLYERLIEKFANQEDQELTVNTHLNRAKVLEIVGRWDEAQSAYEEGQRIAKASRDIVLLGRTNNHLGRLHTLKGDYEKAMNYLRIAAGLFESVDDIFGIARTHSNMGNLYFRTAHYQDALTYYAKSLSNGFSGAGTSSAAETISHLGLTHMNLGDYAEAIRVVEEQIPRHEENQDTMGLASLHTNLGIIYFESGDYDRAKEHHYAGLELAKELGNKRLQAIGMGSLGSVFERKGDYEKAIEHFTKDLQICQELGDRQGIAVVEGLIGDINSVMGNFTKAIQHLDRSLSISRELGYRKGVAKAVNTLGDIYYLQGQLDISLMYYDQAIEIARSTNNRLVLGSSLEEKGRVLLADNQLEALQEVMEEVSRIAEELGNPDLINGVRLLHARALAAYDPQNTEEALLAVETILQDDELTPEQRAEAFLTRFRISEGIDDEARRMALELYEELYAETPKFIFNYNLSILRGDRAF